jgi:Polysaccharide deacetylase
VIEPTLGIVAATAAGAGALASGWAVRRMLRPFPVQGVPILRYRLVGPALAGSPLNDHRVPLSAFDAQVRHLSRRGFKAVSLGEALRRIREPAFLAQNPVALTFDGPYAAFSISAWPVLQRWGMNQVTLFYPPHVLGQRELRFMHGRAEPLMDPRVLRRLAKAGVEVGLQGWPEKTDVDTLTRQLVEGRSKLVEISDQAVDLVCYPPGAPDPDFQAAAVTAGFRAATLIGGGGMLTPRTDPLEILRFRVVRETELLQVAFYLAQRKIPGRAPELY